VSKLQIALDFIADWANDWQLSVSVDKCSVLSIGRGTAVDADFTLGGNVLPAVTTRRLSCDPQARPSTSFVDNTIDLTFRVWDKVPQGSTPLFPKVPEFPYNRVWDR